MYPRITGTKHRRISSLTGFLEVSETMIAPVAIGESASNRGAPSTIIP